MRRGRHERKRTPVRESGDPSLNRPFSSLARTLRSRVVAPPEPPAPKPRAERRPKAAPEAPAPAVPAPDDPALFSRAMNGVVPLGPEARQRVDRSSPVTEPRPPVSEESEAMAKLADLVAGATEFDVTDTREYVEGVVVGLDPRLVRQLRRGDFAWQSYLDLHGSTAVQARAAVERFLVEAMRSGHRCVLIVHGRGHNSKDHTPVLKTKVVAWLSRGALARMVLAFTTARPHDGGAGAMYVLLRRDRRRREFRTSAGPAT